MNSLLLEPVLKDGDVIGVVDDDDDDAEMTSESLRDAGLTPLVVELRGDDPNALVASMRGRVAAVVIDQRLKQRVSFSGVEVVAKCMELHLGAVLLTTWANTMDSAVIQEYKSHIPGVLQRGLQSTPEVLRNALDVAVNESTGRYSVERRPYRTVVRVADTSWLGDQPYADVIISAWSPQQAISIPTRIITSATGVPPEALAGTRFLADVNIYAKEARDVYVTNIVAPDLSDGSTGRQT